MAQLTYTISQRAAAGSCEIYCRFSAERGRVKRGRTGLYIRPERWNADDGCVLLPRFNSNELRTLRDLQHKLDDLENTIVQNYLAHPEQWNEQWLSVQIDKWRTGGVRGDSDSVLDFFSAQQAAHNKYMRSVMRSFRRFEVYRGKIVTFDDFTGALLHEFEGFLRNEWRLVRQYPKLLEIDNKSRTPQPRSDNAIATSFKRLRTLTKTAVGSHKLTVSPFASYTPPQEVYGTPYFLTIAERNALYKFDLSATPRLAVQRDIFVFQCFVGCRVGDFLALKKIEHSQWLFGICGTKNRAQTSRSAAHSAVACRRRDCRPIQIHAHRPFAAVHIDTKIQQRHQNDFTHGRHHTACNSTQPAHLLQRATANMRRSEQPHGATHVLRQPVQKGERCPTCWLHERPCCRFEGVCALLYHRRRDEKRNARYDTINCQPIVNQKSELPTRTGGIPDIKNTKSTAIVPKKAVE